MCDVNLRNKDGDSPLHTVTTLKDPYWARLLLKHSADPLLHNGECELPLDLVVMHGHLEVAQLLIPTDANKSALGPHEHSGFTTFGKVLSGAITIFRGITLLKSFQFLRSLEAVDFIINEKTWASAYHTVLAFNPSQRKDYAAFDRNLLAFIIDCFPNPEHLEYPYNSMMPLHQAVYRSNFDATRMFLDAGAKVNAESDGSVSESGLAIPPGHTALSIAMHRRRYSRQKMHSAGAREIQALRTSCDKIVQLLRERGAKCGSGADGSTRLEAAFPETFTFSNKHCKEEGLTDWENTMEEFFRGLRPDAFRNSDLDRKRRYMGDWPESYEQKPHSIQADALSRAVSPTLKDDCYKQREDLPARWEIRKASNGMIYYVDHNTKSTTWKKPRPDERLLRHAMSGNVESAWGCLEGLNCDVNTSDSTGKTPLAVAVESGHEDFIVMLLEKRLATIESDRVNQPSLDALQLADSKQYEKIVTILRQAALHQAVVTENIAQMSKLIEQGLDINYRIEGLGSVLHIAVASHRLDYVRTLVDLGASIDLIALVMCAAQIKKEQNIVSYFMIEKSYVVDSNTADFVDVMEGLIGLSDLPTLKWFVESGANLHDYHPENSRNLLHVAAGEGELEIAQYLLSMGVDPLSCDCHGMLPIHLAARKGHFTIMKLLALPEITMEDCYGRNIFHHAAMSGSTEVLSLALALVISCGGAPDKADKNGWTALHWAARKGDINVIQELLALDMTITEELIKQWKPSEIADAHRQPMAYPVLLKAEAKHLGQEMQEPEHDPENIVKSDLWPAVGPPCDGCAMVSR